jgi:hypothetical protein
MNADTIIRIAIEAENRVLDTFKAIESAAQRTSAYVQSRYEQAGSKASALLDRTIGQTIKNVQAQSDKIYQTLGEIPNRIQVQGKEIAQRISTPIIGAYQSAMDGARTAVISSQAKITELMQSAVSSIKDKVRDTLVAPYTQAKQQIEKAVTSVTTIVAQMQSKLKEVMENPGGFSKAVLEKTVVEPYRAAMAQVKQIVTDQVNEIKDKLKTATPQGLSKQAQRFGSDNIVKLAEQTGGNFRQATRAAMIGERAGLDTKVLAKAMDSLKQLERLGVPVVEQQNILRKSLKLTEEQFQSVGKAAKVFGQGGGRGGFGGGGGGLPFGALAMGLGAVGFAIQGIKMAFDLAAAVGGRFYQGMIGANEQLNQQILGSAANLAATSRVFVDSMEIIDPTEKIKTLQGPLKDALKQIAQDSIQLVGVTSQDLTGVFATLNSQAAQLTGQSKEFTTAIESAGKLTIDFAAALGTIGMPLQYAGQEIRSILTGTIDMNSTLAKQLGITNDMVKSWKAQGTLVDELRKRLQPFVEGNALAAQSIGGISSNIQDVLQIIQREVGEPLLEPIVKGLDYIYQGLSENRELIQSLLRPFINTVIEAGEKMASLLVPAIESTANAMVAIQPLANDLFTVIGAFAVTTTAVISNMVKSLADVVGLVGKTYNFVMGIVSAINPFDKDVDAALKSSKQSTEVLVNEQKKLEQQYAAIAYKKREGIELTEEEIATEQKLKGLAGDAIDAIDAQIENLESMRTAFTDPNQRKAIDEEIKSLENLKRAYEVGSDVAGIEKRIEALKEQKKAGEGNEEQIDSEIKRLEALKQEYIATGKAAGMAQEFGLSAMELKDKGNEFEQLAKSAKSAMDQVKTALTDGMDPAQFEGQVGALIKATQAQFQAGMITADQAKENLRVITDSNKVSVELKQQAADQINKITETANQRELQETNRKIQEQQALIESGNVGQLEGVQKLTELKQQALNQQLVDVEEQIEKEKQLREEQVKQQVQGLDTQIAEAKAQVDAARNGSERNAALANLAQLEEQKDIAVKSLELQSERGVQLAEKEKQIQEQLKAEVVNGNRQIQSAIEQEGQLQVQAIRAQQSEIQASLDEGKTSRLQATTEITQLQQKEIQTQLDAVAKQIKEEQKLREGTEPTNREKQLLAQQRELNARLRQSAIDAERQLRQVQLDEIQKTSDKVLDAVNLAASERMLAMQEQINKDPLAIRAAERAEMELDIQRDKLEAEYNQEKANLEKIKALPLPRNPEERAKAEDEIRGAMQRTTDLALQLAKMEEQAQRAAIERVQDSYQKALEKRLNQIEAERLALEAQLQAYDQISAQMKTQIDLIEKQISASEKINQTTQFYYDAAAQFASDEEEARRIQQEAAIVRIRQLEEQQEIERIKLELTLQQNKALLEQELIQARIASLQAKADEAQSQADYKMAAADPTTSPEKLEAMRMQIQAKQAQSMAADFRIGMAQQGLENFDRDAFIQRTMLQRQQEQEMFSARADYAKATLTDADDRALGREALGRARRSASSNLLDGMTEEIQGNVGEFNRLAEQLEQLRMGMGDLSTTLPSLIQPIVQSTRSPSIDTPSSPGQASPTTNASGEKVIHFNPVFHNTFGGSGKPDAGAVKDFEQGTLNILKKVLELV